MVFREFDVMIENIYHNEQLISVIIRAQYQDDGINFFTPDSFSQQLAYMNRRKGYEIPPHVHNPVKREVSYTQEVLFIKSGCVRIDYYDNDRNYLRSRILNQGDVVLLSDGGHGFFMCEDSEIIEVKQGPYAGDKDKTRFEPIEDERVRFD